MRDIRQTRNRDFSLIGAMYYLHRDYLKTVFVFKNWRYLKYYPGDLCGYIGGHWRKWR